MKFGNIDLQKLGELQNAKMQNLASTPASPVESQFWYDTANHVPMYYNGTTAKEFGIVYSQGTGIDITGTTIAVASTVLMNTATGTDSLTLLGTASTAIAAVNIGNTSSASALGATSLGYSATARNTRAIAIGSNADANAADAIQIGYGANMTAQTLAVGFYNGGTNKEYTLLDVDGIIPDARISSNIARTSTIPTKISDLTDDTSSNPIDKADTLTGLTASISELNIMDGVTVTATDINSVTSKIGLTDLSIDTGSTNYLDYDNTTGKFSAKVDTTVTQSSSKLVTSGAVYTAIDNAITGGMVYKGVWTATGQTDYSSITLPVKAGYMYLVSGSATIGGIEWNTDDYLVINADVAVGGTITDVKKIDNTEGSDIVRLNASQTLTNKTIDADDNTILDLTTSNLKSGVLQTTVRAVASASDTAIPSEKAVASAFANRVYSVQNPALTMSGGYCNFVVTHNLGTTDVIPTLYEVATGDKVMYDCTITSANVVTYKILSAGNIAADTYKSVVKA